MLSVEEKAFHHLVKISKHHIPLSDVIKQNGILSIPKSEFKIFDYMSRIIIKQQLSNKVAEVIWNRLAEHSDHDLLKFVKIENKEAILKCGLSNRKYEAILRLKKEHETNDLSTLHSHDIDEVKDYINSLYGFGEWSSAMICLFFFQDHDTWSHHDATLNKASKLLEIDQKLIDQASPYKSFLALHLWKAVDSKMI